MPGWLLAVVVALVLIASATIYGYRSRRTVDDKRARQTSQDAARLAVTSNPAKRQKIIDRMNANQSS